MNPRVHSPSCLDLEAHIDAAVRETAGEDITLTEFVDQVRADWADERMLADMGDLVVIEFWKGVEADYRARFAS